MLQLISEEQTFPSPPFWWHAFLFSTLHVHLLKGKTSIQKTRPQEKFFIQIHNREFLGKHFPSGYKMENIRSVKLSRKETKSVKKKHPAKIQKNDLVSDLHLKPIATTHGMSSPSDSSTLTSSSIIPLLSPVYIMVPPQFPDTEDYSNDRSPRMGNNDRSPRRERDPGDKRSLSSKRHSSPTKLADPNTMLMMFQSRCVL